MLEDEKQVKSIESFIHSDVYSDKFHELLSQNKIFSIMVCNDIVLRINRINSHYKFYANMRNKYSMEKTHDYADQLEDFLLVEEIVYHVRKAIDEMIYLRWINEVGVSSIDNKKKNPIDSIGKYLNQNIKTIEDFDDFLPFLNKINILSNSYKHSINTFSPIATDLECNGKVLSFYSYTLREQDIDVAIFQADLTNMLRKIFNKFLSVI